MRGFFFARRWIGIVECESDEQAQREDRPRLGAGRFERHRRGLHLVEPHERHPARGVGGLEEADGVDGALGYGVRDLRRPLGVGLGGGDLEDRGVEPHRDVELEGELLGGVGEPEPVDHGAEHHGRLGQFRVGLDGLLAEIVALLQIADGLRSLRRDEHD
jgi:hypothetical protein